MHMFKIVLLTLCLFFLLSEGDLLIAVERIVTKHSNPSFHHLTFSSTLQLPNETIQEYIVKLISLAPDCAFTCLGCKIYIPSIFMISLFEDFAMKTSKWIS